MGFKVTEVWLEVSQRVRTHSRLHVKMMVMVSYLMANIKDELVLRSVKHVVQGHGEVSDTKACSQVSSSFADIEQYVFPQLFAQLLQLPSVEILDVHWEVDCVQQRSQRLVASGWVNVFQLIH